MKSNKDKLTPYNASHCKDPTAYDAIKNMLTPNGIPRKIADSGVSQEDTTMQDALTKEEKQILAIVRNTGYGEVTIKVRDGKPVLATESRTTKLD